ncbi:ditrans,polycis-polyprenyl diphosphate synthase [Saccharomycopsis crataegensis]|uniref:Alkyl transferase n=1 Tax=Saccharomycopsis crataegensis TaxID=43959 RepID=A0AAV5QRL3_9ASCO|nr:ditrans,polycis-polyprenyl diphosphate synthase [Saccharomycopsis crataegensis]
MSFLLWLSTLPIISYVLELIKHILIRSLRTGNLPNHIAFIMDGNRRYAKQHKLPVSQGHNMGSESLASILELCYKLNIQAVSIYAFSIENFNRSKSEVNYLMDLIQKKLSQISEHGDLVDKFGIKIIFSGNKSFLPKDVYDTFKETEERTKNNGNVILNICFPYTARDDITRSIKKIVSDVKQDKLEVEEIREETVSNNLDTKSLPPLDFMMRTSGVRRLSDYLLWEITDNDAELELLDIYWPELNQLILTWSIFKWSFRKTSLNDFFKQDKAKIE